MRLRGVIFSCCISSSGVGSAQLPLLSGKIRQFTAEEEFRCRDSSLKLDINSKIVVERRPFIFCYGGFSAYCGSSRVQVSFHYQITLLDCM